MIAKYVLDDLRQVQQVLLHYSAFKTTEKGWTAEEQARFWVAFQRFPSGPWTSIAAFIGTKSSRQAMTHAQKLRQKLARWKKKHLPSTVAVQPPHQSCNFKQQASQHVETVPLPALTPAAASIEWLFLPPPPPVICASPQHVNDVVDDDVLDVEMLDSIIYNMDQILDFPPINDQEWLEELLA